MGDPEGPMRQLRREETQKKSRLAELTPVRKGYVSVEPAGVDKSTGQNLVKVTFAASAPAELVAKVMGVLLYDVPVAPFLAVGQTATSLFGGEWAKFGVGALSLALFTVTSVYERRLLLESKLPPSEITKIIDGTIGAKDDVGRHWVDATKAQRKKEIRSEKGKYFDEFVEGYKYDVKTEEHVQEFFEKPKESTEKEVSLFDARGEKTLGKTKSETKGWRLKSNWASILKKDLKAIQGTINAYVTANKGEAGLALFKSDSPKFDLGIDEFIANLEKEKGELTPTNLLKDINSHVKNNVDFYTNGGIIDEKSVPGNLKYGEYLETTGAWEKDYRSDLARKKMDKGFKALLKKSTKGADLTGEIRALQVEAMYEGLSDAHKLDHGGSESFKKAVNEAKIQLQKVAVKVQGRLPDEHLLNRMIERLGEWEVGKVSTGKGLLKIGQFARNYYLSAIVAAIILYGGNALLPSPEEGGANTTETETGNRSGQFSTPQDKKSPAEGTIKWEELPIAYRLYAEHYYPGAQKYVNDAGFVLTYQEKPVAVGSKTASDVFIAPLVPDNAKNRPRDAIDDYHASVFSNMAAKPYNQAENNKYNWPGVSFTWRLLGNGEWEPRIEFGSRDVERVGTFKPGDWYQVVHTPVIESGVPYDVIKVLHQLPDKSWEVTIPDVKMPLPMPYPGNNNEAAKFQSNSIILNGALVRPYDRF